MTTYYARVDYSYSGDSKFTIPFSYIKKDHIVVYVNAEQTTNYTYITSSQIEVKDILKVGDQVSIRRKTPINEKIVNFNDLNILNGETQNLAQEQVLNSVQEIYDENVSFQIDLDNQIIELEQNVDIKVAAVSDAIEKLNILDESIETTVEAAEAATEARDQTFNISDQIIEECQQSLAACEQKVQDCETLTTQAKEYVENAYCPPLLQSFWSDHILNRVDLLRADTFSWQSGTIYEAVYNELVSEYDNASSTNEKDILKENITKVGTLTDTDSVLSGFSEGNYATLSEVPYSTASSIEILLKVNTGTLDTTNYKCFYSPIISNFRGVNFQVTPANLLQLYVSSNSGTSWDIVGGSTGVTTLQSNTTYYFKYVFNGTNHILYSSTTGAFSGEEITEINVTSSAKPSNTSVSLGLQAWASTQNIDYWRGSIDLKESYIKINNELWWTGCDYVNYKRTPKGYKIAAADQETAILNKYNTNGQSWYYILDTVNTQFKLPRTKFGFEGLRSYVGDDIEAGLPNITGQFNCVNSDTSGAFNETYTNYWGVTWGNGQLPVYTKTLNASLSNPIYGNSNTVQEPATQMYLYFYVGNYTQSAIEQTAGINTELFNNKADKTEVELLETEIESLKTAYITETYVNGTSGYNVYSNGYCEQWGLYSSTGTHGTQYSINLLKQYANTDYNIIEAHTSVEVGATSVYFNTGYAKNVDSFTIQYGATNGHSYSFNYYWKTSGYIR